jgi:hypothetical protein
MSVSRVVLPVLDLEQNDKPIIKQVVKGCKNYTEQRITADSFSDTSCSFNFSPPSQNTIVDRCFQLEVTATLGNGILNGMDRDQEPTGVKQTMGFQSVRQNYNGALAFGASNALETTAIKEGVNVKMSNNFAPKQFPLARSMDSIDLTLNGTHFTASVNQYVNAVMRYTTPEYRQKVFSETAHKPDRKRWVQCAGDEDSPMNIEPSDGIEDPRGININSDEVYKVSTAGGFAKSLLTVKYVEPLFLSPLMTHHGLGMTNVNDIQVTINWNGNLKNSFALVPLNVAHQTSSNGVNYGNYGLTARNNGAADSEITEAILTASFASVNPVLKVRYYTPQDDIKIPNEIVLPYKQPKIVVQKLTANPSHTAFTSYTGNHIRLNQVPECCYIYAKIARGSDTPLQEDLFSFVNKVNIDWNNQSGLLSALDSNQLLKISQENGYDWKQSELTENGNVLKLCFGKDIPLPDNVSAGSRGDYSWQLSSIELKNLRATMPTELYQVFVYQGQAVVSPNECRVQTGLLTLEDNVNAEDMGNELHQHSSMEGGSSVGGSIVGGSLVGDMTKHMVKHFAGKNKMLKSLAEPAGKLADKAFEKYKTRN